MAFTQQLPHVGDLIRLSRLATPYPISRKELLWFVSVGRFGEELTDFLLLFPKDRVFLSAEDFLTQAEELELLINQEWNSPPEVLRSPQD